jgi:hypothetical protein
MTNKSKVEIERLDGMTGYRLSRLVAKLKCLRGVKKSVFRVLADYYPNVWPAVGTIAEESGSGTTQTKKSLRELEREGWISEIVPKGAKRPKPGGRWSSVQYKIDVHKILTVIEAQEREKEPEQTGRPPSSSDDSNPTATDAKATLTDANPTLTDAKATATVEEENKKRVGEEKKERIEKSTPHPGASVSLSSLSRQGKPSSPCPLSERDARRLTDFVVQAAKGVAQSAIFYRKDRLEIQRVIAEKRATQEELKAVVKQKIGDMDNWALKRAGDTLCAELAGSIDRFREEQLERQRQAEEKARLNRQIAWTVLDEARAELRKAQKKLCEARRRLNYVGEHPDPFFSHEECERDAIEAADSVVYYREDVNRKARELVDAGFSLEEYLAARPASFTVMQATVQVGDVTITKYPGKEIR